MPFLAFAWICLMSTGVWAATGMDPTAKHAWAENVGWANAVPTNGGVAVHFDGASGYLTGLAWGENIGWIKLGNDAGGPYANTSAGDWGVNLDAAGNLTGLAWGENVGWIKFNPDNSAVTIDMATGCFNGDAWGENIGWVRFKGTTPDYNVRTLAFDKQPHGTPNWWLDNQAVIEDYDDGDGVPAWQEYVMDTDPKDPASYLYIARAQPTEDESGYILNWPCSPSRVYDVQTTADFLSEVWTPLPGWTNLSPASGNLTITNLYDVSMMQYFRLRVHLPE